VKTCGHEERPVRLWRLLDDDADLILGRDDPLVAHRPGLAPDLDVDCHVLSDPLAFDRLREDGSEADHDLLGLCVGGAGVEQIVQEIPNLAAGQVIE
jgi:hypothetical protein